LTIVAVSKLAFWQPG